MRYSVHAPTKGVPFLGSVLTPPLTRTYAGWSSRGQIYGQPGTQAVPIIGRDSLHTSTNDLANVGTSMGASAPDVIYPPLYWVAGEQEHAPVSRVSDNQMPVPATRPVNVLRSAPYVTRKGGQRQVYQPQVVPVWKGLRGTTYG